MLPTHHLEHHAAFTNSNATAGDNPKQTLIGDCHNQTKNKGTMYTLIPFQHLCNPWWTDARTKKALLLWTGHGVCQQLSQVEAAWVISSCPERQCSWLEPLKHCWCAQTHGRPESTYHTAQDQLHLGFVLVCFWKKIMEHSRDSTNNNHSSRSKHCQHHSTSKLPTSVWCSTSVVAILLRYHEPAEGKDRTLTRA